MNLSRVITISFTLFFVVNSSVYAEGLNQKQYSNLYTLKKALHSSEWGDVKECISNWNDHPFKDVKTVRFRVISPNVVVFGLGDKIVDNTKTSYPQLIYIKPSVNVMGKTTFELMNPNGWYCFKSKVNIMGKSVIQAACNAHIAIVSGKITVAGKGAGETSGTTIMGKSILEQNCD